MLAGRNIQQCIQNYLTDDTQEDSHNTYLSRLLKWPTPIDVEGTVIKDGGGP